MLFARHPVPCRPWIEDLRLNRARQRLVSLILAFLITYISRRVSKCRRMNTRSTSICIRPINYALYSPFGHEIKTAFLCLSLSLLPSSHQAPCRALHRIPLASPNNEDCFLAVYRDFGRKCRALSAAESHSRNPKRKRERERRAWCSFFASREINEKWSLSRDSSRLTSAKRLSF